MHGKGTLYLDDMKFEYQGEFKNNLKHGNGKASIAGEEYHDGKWRNDDIYS